MKLSFLFPGKTREPYAAEGIRAYLKRLTPMAAAEIHILKGATAAPHGGAAAESRAKAQEAARIVERCAPGDYLIALDGQGRTLSSPDLAALFEKLALEGRKTVHLAVGGPWGLAGEALARADFRLSLGPMTYPHDLARLIIVEQVYRAYAIINKIPYHK